MYKKGFRALGAGRFASAISGIFINMGLSQKTRPVPISTTSLSFLFTLWFCYVICKHILYKFNGNDYID